MRTQLTIKAMLCGTVFCPMTATPAVLAQAADSAVIALDQGANWTETDRAKFYSQDQGSQIMPLSWLEASNSPTGSLFSRTVLAAMAICQIRSITTAYPLGLPPPGRKASLSPA
jgi:hypothetical protein